ncbi:MAG: hypothetical protein ABSH22_05980 [Tepidisphaeraceae bacterium]
MTPATPADPAPQKSGRLSLSPSAFNLPWVGRNPTTIATWILLFTSIMWSPILVMGVVNHLYRVAIVTALAPVGMFTLFFGVGRFIRRMSSRVELRLAAMPGEAQLHCDCAMVNGMIQSPAIAEVRGEKLILAPLVGKMIELPLAGVSVKSECKWFNGKLLFGTARGFWLKVPDRTTRLGFAVEDAVLWREVLNHSNQPTAGS